MGVDAERQLWRRHRQRPARQRQSVLHLALEDAVRLSRSEYGPAGIRIAGRPGFAGDAGRPLSHVAVRQESDARSEEHTYELQSLMRNSYAVFCLKTKTNR